MSTDIAKIQPPSSVMTIGMNEHELIEVLQSSVYPGAKPSSIKMVINVCRAANKDPLKKPYHIVPMPVSTGRKDSNGWDVKEMRDVVMPGINDYRTDAARTGQHAGTSEPEFGPDISETLDGVAVTYPAWCRITVKRQISSGLIVEFSAVERWKENYATKSNKSEAPNAMWRKRPYAQLAKCAEAQALRKGFPEVGNQPTADEMEGKEIDMGHAVVVDEHRAPPAMTVAPPAMTVYPDDKFAENLPKWRELIASKKKTADQIIKTISSKLSLSDAQKAAILAPNADKQNEPDNGSISYAQVEEMLRTAEHLDHLDVAGDLIGKVADADHRAELTEIYHQRREALGA